MPATGRNPIQRRHQPRHQRQLIRKWLPLYRDQPPAAFPAFVPLRAAPKRQAEALAIIELPLGEQSITVKWPMSDPEGCARFVRGLTQ
jgi:hypothetical protein